MQERSFGPRFQPNLRGTMFGLPIGTVLLVFAFPLLWILYTLGFLLVTRDWDDEEDET